MRRTKRTIETSGGCLVYRHGIFCLEGDWSLDLKNFSSVEPVLKILAESHISRVPHIYRDIGTPGEFKYYLKKWIQSRYDRYPILYLGFHGNRGNITLGDLRMAGSRVSLDDLEEWLSGACRRRVIYFGSCETMTSSASRLQQFLKNTRAVAIIGYKRTVDWLESMAVETLLLGELQHNAITRAGLRAVKQRIQRLLRGSNLYRRLGFRMIIRNS